MDRAIAGALHGFWGRVPAFDAAMAFAAEWVPYAAFAAFIAVFFFVALRDAGSPFMRRAERMRHALASFMGLAALFGIVLPAIRLAYRPLRPFAEFGWKPLVAMDPAVPSFPSGHAAFMFFLAAYAWRHDRRAGRYLAAFAVLNAAARGYAGVHFASDLACGALLGIVAAYAADRAVPGLARENPGAV